MKVNRAIVAIPTSVLEVSAWKGPALLLADWAAIVGAFWLTKSVFGHGFYPVAIVIIGSRMMGLWALLHDGHHQLIAKPKWINGLLTKYLIAWPLFIKPSTYARQHRAHHINLGGPGDPNFDLLRYPEFKFPMATDHLIVIFIKDLLGLNYITYRIKDLLNGRWPNRSDLVLGIIFLSTLAWLRLLDEFVLFWVIPYVTYFQFLLRLTLISDHCFTDQSNLKVRSVRANALVSTFVVPHNLNLHAEHHYFAKVPCYNLPKLRLLLIKNGIVLPNSVHAPHYFSVLRELTGSPTHNSQIS